MTVHLKLDLYLCNVHAQERMRELGITYQHATPQSLYESWWFWNCENVPDPLPEDLSILRLDPLDVIGNGLNKEMAMKIKAAEK